jgi:DMSO/TMAO reductase YedYZ molybdopterin-dependent catalytic subunit
MGRIGARREAQRPRRRVLRASMLAGALITAPVVGAMAQGSVEDLARSISSSSALHSASVGQASTDTLLLVDGEGVPAARAFTAADLASLPRQDVWVQPHHAPQPSTFSGVSLSDVLRSAGAWDPKSPRGAWARSYVVVSAADGYRAVYALSEVDTAVTDKLVLLAYRRDGEPLAKDEGPLRLVAPGEKREGRWVRQVVRITVRRAKQ